MVVRRGSVRVSIAVVLATASTVVGCALFSDLGGFSNGDADASSAEASTTDGATTDDGPAGTDGTTPVVDAGPDAPPYKLAVLEDKPIAYWPMDDAPGSVFVSELVGNKKADFAGVLTFGVAGVSGTAIDKTDVQQVLEVGDYFDFVGLDPYTVEVWAKPSINSKYPTIIAKRRPNVPFGWNAYFQEADQAGIPGFQFQHVSPDGGNRTVFATTPDAATKWHHIVVTYDPKVATGAAMRMYYDGIRTDGFDDDVPAIDTTEPVWIGLEYTGLLDEIALYDHALTVERVQAHYQLGNK